MAWMWVVDARWVRLCISETADPQSFPHITIYNERLREEKKVIGISLGENVFFGARGELADFFELIESQQ